MYTYFLNIVDSNLWGNKISRIYKTKVKIENSIIFNVIQTVHLRHSHIHIHVLQFVFAVCEVS